MTEESPYKWDFYAYALGAHLWLYAHVYEKSNPSLAAAVPVQIEVVGHELSVTRANGYVSERFTHNLAPGVYVVSLKVDDGEVDAREFSLAGEVVEVKVVTGQ